MASFSTGPSDAKRILAVAALPPWPMEDGYSLRAGHFLEELAEDHYVTLVSPGPEDQEPPGTGRLDWHTVPELPATNALAWRDEQEILVARISSLLAETDVDAAVLWNGVEFLADDIPGFPPTIGDRIDCGVLQVWRNRGYSRGFRDTLRELRRGFEMAVYERRVLQSLDRVVVTGPDDANALRVLTNHERISVIPNGVALPELESLPDESDAPTVIFTGVLSYPPNVEAARYFVREIWPSVLSRVPDARFVIAGRSPTSDVWELESDPSIQVKPDVADMTAEIRRAWIAVAPMRSGSGIKNKVLEAWAAERPVVMTQLATNGLALEQSQEELRDLVCDEDEFTAKITMLLEDHARRKTLGRAVRSLASKRHSWCAAGEELKSMIFHISS